MEPISHNVRYFRKLRGMTQTELARAAGTTQYTVSEIELAHREPHPATLRKLAAALGVRVADLYGDPSSPLAPAPTSVQLRLNGVLVEDEQGAQPSDGEIRAMDRWLSYLEQRLAEGDMSRDEIAHDLDAARAFAIGKNPGHYPDDLFDRFMRLLRRALQEGKSFDALQSEAAELEADMRQLEEEYAEAKERQT